MLQFNLLLLGWVPLFAGSLSAEDSECLGTGITKFPIGTGKSRLSVRWVEREKLTGKERHG